MGRTGVSLLLLLLSACASSQAPEETVRPIAAIPDPVISSQPAPRALQETRPQARVEPQRIEPPRIEQRSAIPPATERKPDPPAERLKTEQKKIEPALPDLEIVRILIRMSLASYPGNCPCPYNSDRAGRSCGARSAYSKPGGRSPLCYEHDSTPEMIQQFRARQAGARL